MGWQEVFFFFLKKKREYDDSKIWSRTIVHLNMQFFHVKIHTDDWDSIVYIDENYVVDEVS
jgi:hypothetical protein